MPRLRRKLLAIDLYTTGVVMLSSLHACLKPGFLGAARRQETCNYLERPRSPHVVPLGDFLGGGCSRYLSRVRAAFFNASLFVWSGVYRRGYKYDTMMCLFLRCSPVLGGYALLFQQKEAANDPAVTQMRAGHVRRASSANPVSMRQRATSETCAGARRNEYF